MAEETFKFLSRFKGALAKVFANKTLRLKVEERL